MKRTVWIWSLCGFSITSLLGTIFHFLYEWFGESAWIAPFSGVNESTWEHMKLLFWPMLLFTLFQSFFFRDYKCFASVKLRSMLIGLILIPVLFYTYNGVIGKSPDFINITIFFISAALAYVYETRAFNKKAACRHPRIAIAIMCILGMLFIIFTFKTPPIGIFLDPITHTFGMQNS